MKNLIGILLIISATAVNAQKLVYDIYLFGGKIGQSVIEKNIRNDSVTQYSLRSSSEVHVFFTVKKVSLVYDIVYKFDYLLSSYSKSIRNEELHITTINRENDNYIMKRDGVSYCIKPLVECTTVKLFYNEPCDAQQVFSERLGEYRTIRKIAEGIYTAEMAEGVTYYYRYKNGKLYELEMKKGMLGSVYLRIHNS